MMQKVESKDDSSELAKCLRGDYGLVWSHCDLNSSNILVDPITLQITGILDWEKSRIAPPVNVTLLTFHAGVLIMAVVGSGRIVIQ